MTSMGPLVVTSGRITLPAPLEEQALTVLEVELRDLEGPFDPERLSVGGAPVESLADLAGLAGVTALREGDALVFSTDHQGEPRWTPQAAGFWTGLGRFATGGEIHLRGADGTTWSYRYSPEGVRQVGAPPAGGLGGEPPRRTPEPPPASPPAAAAPPPTERRAEPPPEPSAEPSVGGWPPPVPPPADPAWSAGPPGAPGEPPRGPADPYAALFDDSAPPPRSSGRTAAMAALLVVGVVLIVAVAMLTAGIF